jgi:hypothetical protein
MAAVAPARLTDTNGSVGGQNGVTWYWRIPFATFHVHSTINLFICSSLFLIHIHGTAAPTNHGSTKSPPGPCPRNRFRGRRTTYVALGIATRSVRGGAVSAEDERPGDAVDRIKEAKS